MRASDMAWAWVAHKAHRGQAVGKVFRPELGPLDEEQVLWQLVAMATTGWKLDVRENITRETLKRAVLARQVLKSIYRVTDKDTAMQNGVTVKEVQDMELGPVMMTPRLAAMVLQNVNTLQGLRGRGMGRAKYWACLHMLMWEVLIEGSVGKHHCDREWDGMVEETKRLKALGKGEHYVFNPEDQLRGSLGDSPDVGCRDRPARDVLPNIPVPFS